VIFIYFNSDTGCPCQD